jgi:hypothetical protein
LRELSFVLDSTLEKADFSFQFDVRGAAVHDEKRTVVNRVAYDWRPYSAIELRYSECCAPTLMAIDCDIYSFNFVPPWQHVTKARWEHVLTTKQIYTWFQVSDNQREPGGLVRLDLGNFLRGIVTPKDAGLVWMPDCRSLRLDRSNGVTYTLRIRTPNDADRYGTSLSQFRNVGDDGVSSFAWSHFIVGRPSVLRFQKPTKEALKKLVGECKTVDYSDSPLLPHGSRTAGTVRPLWDALVVFPKCEVKDVGSNRAEGSIASLCKSIDVLRWTPHVESTPSMRCIGRSAHQGVACGRRLHS